MNIDESTPPYDYTSMKYWDERYAADETVYEWQELDHSSNKQGDGLQSI